MSEFCAELSLAMGAPLHGTASEQEVWLLLSYSGEWRIRAAEDNDLPVAVQAWLNEQLIAIPKSRLVLIKQDRPMPLLTFAIAVTRADDQRLYRFEFDSFEALQGLDVSGIVSGSAEAPLSSSSFLLVCTNGKRDQCCARFGLPVYRAMQQAAPPEVELWQSTHLGGHRYAAVVLALPLGVMYGYVAPEHTAELLASVTEKRIVPTLYRGRTFYDGVSNSADFYLRRHLNDWRADGLKVDSAEALPDHRYAIDFNSSHTVTIHQTMTPPVLIGCTLNKSEPQPNDTLISIE